MDLQNEGPRTTPVTQGRILLATYAYERILALQPLAYYYYYYYYYYSKLGSVV